MSSKSMSEFITELYNQQPHPLYLSKLGMILKKNGYPVINLKETITNLDGFTVVQGNEKERTAIAKIEDKDTIQDKLLNIVPKVDKKTLEFLARLNKNILFAFCSKSKVTGSCYIEKEYPFHRFPTNEKGNLLEIPRDLLLDEKIPANLKFLPADVATNLSKNIKEWLESNNISIDSLLKKQTSAPVEDTFPDCLLARVISAIPDKERHRVCLPLDIISYLMK